MLSSCACSVHAHVHAHARVHVHVHVHVCMHSYTCACACACVHAQLLSMHMSGRVHVCAEYMHMHMCMHMSGRGCLLEIVRCFQATMLEIVTMLETLLLAADRGDARAVDTGDFLA